MSLLYEAKPVKDGQMAQFCAKYVLDWDPTIHGKPDLLFVEADVTTEELAKLRWQFERLLYLSDVSRNQLEEEWMEYLEEGHVSSEATP